jgi:L-asparaginase
MSGQRDNTSGDPTKGKVLIVYTGGTIGMGPKDPSNPASPLVPKSLEELKHDVPTLKELEDKGIVFSFTSFEPPLDSSDVTPRHWVEIARKIRDGYDSHGGFVVLHGTDTMAYTASALAFLLENLAKPVVVTGSQLPISEVRTDAVQNLVSSIYIAAHEALGLPKIPEVVLCFSTKILRGCRATKVSTNEFEGFDSPNCPPLGTIGEHIEVNERILRHGPARDAKFLINERLADERLKDLEILEIGLFPGFRASQLKALLESEDVTHVEREDVTQVKIGKGVVLRTFGAGNAPNDLAFLDVLKWAINEKSPPCVVVNVTKCQKGMVEMGLYAASSTLLERGVISGLDMTSEAALVKLYWTLVTKTGVEITRQMQVNQRGEQSENLFDLRYGSCGSENQPRDRFEGTEIPDNKLVRDRVKRAAVRLSGVTFSDVREGDKVTLRVFMNDPLALYNEGTTNKHCVAEFVVDWMGEPLTLIQDITSKWSTVCGDSGISLSVLLQEGAKMRFDGLYLALFAKAE